jgi:dTDP-4-dehydrorhamnose 3,5-epimerase
MHYDGGNCFPSLDGTNNMLRDQSKKDIQTVTTDGELVAPMIEGVRIRPARTLPDDRGTVCEIFNPAWGFDDEPLVYAYQITIRANKIKGWVVHYEQDDRLFISQGTLKIVLYDDRAESPTYRLISEVYLGEHNRALIRIPRGVFHALQNVGDSEALFINMPTRPYNHANPDKRRLPLDTDLIPYRFETRLGW